MFFGGVNNDAEEDNCRNDLRSDESRTFLLQVRKQEESFFIECSIRRRKDERLLQADGRRLFRLWEI